jgi:Cutinase/von Willebrand factor type A domain/PKD domain
MRSFRFTAVPLLILGLVMPASVAAAADAEATASASCPPYEVIGARGSGQGEIGGEMNMGPEIYEFFTSLQGLIGSGVVSGHGVKYPAVDATSLHGVGAALHIGFLGKYTGSVRDGAKAAEERIRERHEDCRSTRFILAGYSQGAQALGDLLQRSPVARWVVAAAFFGDPYFNANSWSARGTFDPAAYGAFGPRPEWEPSLQGRVFSYCHYHDVICNVSNRRDLLVGPDVYVRNPANISVKAHVTPAYQLVNGGLGDVWLAARDVARALGFAPSPIPYSGPLDVVFVIDSTGSMSEEIEEVKENVAALVQQIGSINSDYRLALVDYKDTPEEDSEYQSRLDTGFTTDIPNFKQHLDAIEAGGGGDEAESVYSGLMTALNLDWRAGAKKIVVQIGDAPAKDPEPITGLTLRAVQLKALSVDPATIDTFQSGDEADTRTSFMDIANATGGQFVQLPDSENLTGLIPAITNEIRRNTTAPAATLVSPSLALAGQSVTLSAGASQEVGEAIAGYDWDFTGDGTYDTSTTAPVASTTYAGPFTGTATVRVRTASGLSSLATAPISVGLSATKRPGKPGHPRKKVQRRKLTLYWATGKGGTPQWFTIYAKGKPLARIPVAGDPRRTAGGKRRLFTATVRGLRPGQVYRYAITAGNDAGESARSGKVVVRTAPKHKPHKGGRRVPKHNSP